MEKIKLAIGFIVYGQTTAKYLPRFVPSLLAAEATVGLEARFLVLDNQAADDSNSRYLAEHLPDAEVFAAETNLGFARGFNRLIQSALDRGDDFLLAVNPDTVWQESAIKYLLAALMLNDRAGSATPKVLSWDFATDQLTTTIDTCGLVAGRGLNFFDLAQGQPDQGQCDNVKIIGPSGCAALYRLAALASVGFVGQYFDELMFMYKEDVDLALRLRLAGWSAELVPQAIVWHDRSVSRRPGWLARLKSMRGKSDLVKYWSLKHQLILVYKYWRRQGSAAGLAILADCAARLLYAALFDWPQLKAVREFWQIRKKIVRPR